MIYYLSGRYATEYLPNAFRILLLSTTGGLLCLPENSILTQQSCVLEESPPL